MSELKTGVLLQSGKYIIEKSLGQGGFGITYLAEQTNLGRKVCIKEFFMKEYGERTAAPKEDSQETVLTDGVSSPKQGQKDNDATVLTGVSAVTSAAAAIMGRYREKFVKEARTIARLDHPGIVRIHDVFEENGTAYYVMDFIEGENLNDLVKREGALPEERALGYIRQVADALSYVHGHNIMHLDVKPANIIVRKSDDKAILIDFGTAKQYDSEGTQTSTTPVGLSVGYAPIEMTKPGGVQTFSPETDVYSLGATLYYLVTGQNPPDASERMEMIMEGEKFQLPDSISNSTAEVIEQSMQARKKRIQNVNGFLELLNSDGEKRRLEAEEKAAKEAEAERQEVLRIEREKEAAEKKRIAEEKAREEAETKRQEALRKEQERAEAEKKRIADKEAQNNKTIKWVLIGFAAVVCAVILILIKMGVLDNNSSYSYSNYSGDGPTEMRAEDLLGKGTKNGHEWVDLGLSVKWATCNVGASSPGDFGSFFSWGETCEKSDYSNTTYHLNAFSDVAKERWGGNWRMPTDAECEELMQRCRWKWMRMDGKEGFKVTGLNGNSIFLPAAGERSSTRTDPDLAGSSGNYWSSSTNVNGTPLKLGFNRGGPDGQSTWMPGLFGLPVRPVTE